MNIDLSPMLRANADALQRRHPGSGNVVISPLPVAVEVDTTKRPAPGVGTILRAAASVVWDDIAATKNLLPRLGIGAETLSRKEAETLHLLAHYQTQGGGQMVVSGVFAEHAARRPHIYTVDEGVTPSIKIIKSVTEPAKVVFERIVDGLERNAEARDRASREATPGEGGSIETQENAQPSTFGGKTTALAGRAIPKSLRFNRAIGDEARTMTNLAGQPARVLTPKEGLEIFQKDVKNLLDEDILRSARQETASLRAIVAASPAEISEALELFAAPGEKSPDVARAKEGFAELIDLAEPTLALNSDPAWGNRGDVTMAHPTATTNFLVVEHDADWEKVYAVQQALPASLETEIAGCTLGTCSEREGWILFTKDASRAVAECVRNNAPAELLDATVQASKLLRMAATLQAEAQEVAVTRAADEYLHAPETPAAPGEEPGQHP